MPDRPGADGVSRQGPRPSARDAGPARDAAHLRQMGRPHRISRRRTCHGVARVSGNAVGAPRSGVAGNAVGRLYPARAGRRFPGVRSPARAAARPRPHQGGRSADQGQQTADDLRRQRRDPCARGNPRTRRDDRRARGGVPQRARHRLQRARTRADHGGGLQAVAEHRSDDRDRHADGIAGIRIPLALPAAGPEIRSDRYRSGRNAPACVRRSPWSRMPRPAPPIWSRP